MAREDYERRRLRGLYDRNKRRVTALADARDSHRGGSDEMAAPRRYVVTERRTRVEGFGRGGTQIRRVVRTTRGGGRPSSHFSDRGIFRGGARDRFRRDEDFDREMRRERFFESRRHRFGGRRGPFRGGDRLRDDMPGGGRVDGTGRFGLARSRRMRMRDRRRREGGGGHGVDMDLDGECGRGRGPRRGNNNKGNNSKGNNNRGGRGNRQHQEGGGRRGGGRGRDPMPTREQLDAQLDSYRAN